MRGIVYYVNYLKYMERSRTEFLRSLGYHKPAILEDNLLLVVHCAHIDYHRSARLDDELTVTATLIKVARSYVEFNQQVYRNQELLCSGVVRVACIDSHLFKPRAMPDLLHQKLKHIIETHILG